MLENIILCSAYSVTVLQARYHALDYLCAALSRLSLKGLVLYDLGLIGLIGNGADNDKGLVVEIARLSYGGALHLAAHTAEVGDYLFLLLLFADELVA